MADTSTSFNPTTMAQQLATAYTSGMQTRLDGQVADATATTTALGKLQTALQTFDSALTAMSSKKSVLARSATLSDTSLGTVSASGTALPGNYSFFVEQLASAHQVAYNNVPTVPAAGVGTMNVQLAGGTDFDVNFSAADTNGDGTLSQAEMASAINQAPDNKGTVNASVITVGTTKQLVLSSTATGAGGQITLDTSAMSANPLTTALASGTTLSTGKDAIVWLGAKDSGIPLQQGSNTFNAIDGVSMTFTKVSAPGSAPAMLTVSSDDSTTAANVQAFVDAFNALQKTMGTLTQVGNKDAGTTSAAFASDASVRALNSRLNQLVRQQVGGLGLLDYGVSADRDGNLQLDKAKLT
ncbi:MAG: fliD, partial [Rhizobacter sp.]|nr:fliD [Rhizobacter sp.]